MGTTDKSTSAESETKSLSSTETKEYKQRIAKYLSDEEKKILYSGEGFIRVPDEEAKREKIDAYPYLIL